MNDQLVQDTKLFNLSTRSTACNNLNGDYYSQCEYSIPDMISPDDTIEFVHLSIPYVVIPVSFYNLNYTVNTLVIVVSGVTTKYTFTRGNFSSSTFMTLFSSIVPSNFVISFDFTTNLFTVKNTNSIDFTFSSASTIGAIMGFSNSCSSVGASLTLPRSCNFLPLPRITLRCPELSNSVSVGSTNRSDAIITIPNNASSNGQIYYQNQTQSKILFRHQELSRFVISFTDDDGNFINFNGLPCFFTLQFDVYRKYVPKPPKFSDIIQHVNDKITLKYPDEENPMMENQED